MFEKKQAKIKIQYRRSVNVGGNRVALDTIYRVFQKTDVEWRGLGVIKESGLKLRDEYSNYDVDSVLQLKLGLSKEHPKCICGNVIKGINSPVDCKLYAKECTPESPVGPCMVSSEGTCAAYYKYGERT